MTSTPNHQQDIEAAPFLVQLMPILFDAADHLEGLTAPEMTDVLSQLVNTVVAFAFHAPEWLQGYYLEFARDKADEMGGSVDEYLALARTEVLALIGRLGAVSASLVAGVAEREGWTA